MGTRREPGDAHDDAWGHGPDPGATLDESAEETHHRTAPHSSELSRPERPDLSDTTPAPLLSVGKRPRAVSLTANGWSGGTLLLTFAAITMLLTRNLISGRLEELLIERDASIDKASVETASSRLVLALFGALLLATLFAVLAQRSFSRRRWGARSLMAVVFVVVLVVAGLAAVVVPTNSWQGWLLVGGLALAVVSLLFGLLASLGPGVKAWLREGRPEDLPSSG